MTHDAHHAGCRELEAHDAASGHTVPLLVLYPSSSPERAERVGRFTMDVAMDGAVAAGCFPLVVVSHGTGGSHLLYRTLAAHLARAGYVVALLLHPRNNRDDDSLAGTRAILENRPREVRVAIDRVYADDALGPRLARDRVAIVGHSLGGYTALAVAGGRPWSGPYDRPPREPSPVPVVHDPRVKALVLLAPATPWFMARDALRDVRVPILVLTGEHDVHTPAWHAEVVVRGVPDASRVEHRVVANAGHYSFLSPFPEAMTSATFPPSQDPPGFDRARFHDELPAMVDAFLQRALR